MKKNQRLFDAILTSSKPSNQVIGLRTLSPSKVETIRQHAMGYLE